MAIVESSQRGPRRDGPAPDLFRAHDLLWGMDAEHLLEDAPAWASEVLAAGWPVVVRRAPARPGWLAVGLRGHSREQRWAGWLPLEAVMRCTTPEALRQAEPQRELPAWQALRQVRAGLDATGLAWGITGGAGFELASGVPVLHGASDLDLLLRTPQPFSRDAARALLAELNQAACRIDLQLQTPTGGLALAEWAGEGARVMVKGDHAPVLLADPWARAEVAA
ncbi:malonate decarboxylase holo-ACP synthase [Pseudomonas sp. JH-2]|uniref:malonate decarboxylase holo-ACP synthase n=1 Tax=Pseudomonas sp. JH-2 TaxID=3114998 RepID=UPI002E2737D3|nr:malonate decarboxylase holo-ACP synthase [Pseudomonas sp. JH-2]